MNYQIWKTQRIEEEKKQLIKCRAEKKELIKKRREEWKAKGKIYPIKEEENEEDNKNSSYKNIKNDCISTKKDLKRNNNVKTKKKKELVHSYSVENYSDVLNKSLSNYNENLEKLENSKIMEVEFIKGMRDTKRKDTRRIKYWKSSSY